MPAPAFLVGSFKPGASRSPDLVASALMFVVGGDVSDRLMQAHRVVVDTDPFELRGQDGGLGDGHQVGLLVSDVAPQGLDRRASRCRSARSPALDDNRLEALELLAEQAYDAGSITEVIRSAAVMLEAAGRAVLAELASAMFASADVG